MHGNDETSAGSSWPWEPKQHKQLLIINHIGLKSEQRTTPSMAMYRTFLGRMMRKRRSMHSKMAIIISSSFWGAGLHKKHSLWFFIVFISINVPKIIFLSTLIKLNKIHFILTCSQGEYKGEWCHSYQGTGCRILHYLSSALQSWDISWHRPLQWAEIQ